MLVVTLEPMRFVDDAVRVVFYAIFLVAAGVDS